MTTSPRVPVAPAPAATLVLLRDRPAGEQGPGAVEALLIRRHSKSRFAAGDHVFAGGKVEAEDIPDDAEGFCAGLSPDEAAAALGQGLGARAALSYWIGAIREAFEEVGMLLAYRPDGGLVRFTPDNRSRFEAHRQACQQANAAFFTMLRAESLTLATDRLAYFAHWITPEENPLRFDTRFFAAVAPLGQEAEADGREITAVRWLTPAEALAAVVRKEISLRNPTIKNLELVQSASGGGDAAATVAALRGRQVSTIRPRLLTVDGKLVAVLPGDPRWF